jgi:TPP-dependent pyruvate/acetoin dehydrogenase alpha subunit
MADLLAIQRIAVRARLLDERLAQLARAGKIGFHPDARGLEPAIVAAVLAMREGDHVFPSARDHAAFLARGMPVARYVAHAIGSREDPMAGHAAPAHLASRELRIGSPSGLVSNHLTHATGLAWAARLREDPLYVLAMFGESAANAGDFHSAVNFAGATKSNVIFFCRTDRTTARLPTPVESVADKAIAYGVASAVCSADDAANVAEVIERARASEGPTLIEAVRADPRDPLEALSARLASEKEWSAAKDGELRREIMGEIEAALADAQKSGPPPRESLFEHVLADVPSHLREQRAQLLAHTAGAENKR